MFLQQLSATHLPRCRGLIDPEHNEASFSTPLEDPGVIRYLHLGHIPIDISL
ncbi:MAG: hypothetical protein P8Y09_11015 [Deltaproteobacteria bacterium]|jgi:hypothetical protein